MRTPREFGSIGGTSVGSQGEHNTMHLTHWQPEIHLQWWHLWSCWWTYSYSIEIPTKPSHPHHTIQWSQKIWFELGRTPCGLLAVKNSIFGSSLPNSFSIKKHLERSFDTTQGLFCTVSIDEHFEWHSNDGRLSKNFDLLKSQESNSLVFTYVCILSSCSPNSGWASRSVRDWCRGHSNRWEWSIFSSVVYHKLAFI